MQTDHPILGMRSEWLPMDGHRYTVDEYLAFERGEPDKHMFLDGRIFEFHGEDWKHGGISVNVVAAVGSNLKATPFRAYTKRTCIYSGSIPAQRTPQGLFFYPDVVIFAVPEFLDEHIDTVLNPKVIIEILSSSTEAFDRGEKFQRLQKHNPTLTDYILIAQDKPQIEHFRRQRKGSWSYDSHAGLEANVVIASISCTLPLADVYDRVVFPEG